MDRVREGFKNNKSLIKNIAGTIGVKGLSLFISLLTTAAYLRYFEENKVLGTWLSLVNILNWIIVFDLGVGNGLRNKLVESLAEDDKKKSKQYVSSGYCILGVISILIVVAGNIAFSFVNWNTLINISEDIISADVLLLVVRILFSGIIVQFFLRTIISILYAVQKAALANLIALLSNSLILLFVNFVHIEDVGKGLIVISIVQCVAVNLPLLFATGYIFFLKYPDIRPGTKYYVKGFAKNIMNLGYRFFWVQIALLIINSTNDFIITRLFGPEYVVQYQIYDKIFTMISSGFSLLTVPIWSAITHAYCNKQFQWIKKVYNLLMLAGIAVSVVALVLPFFYQQVVNLWLGEQAITVDIRIAFLFAIYSMILIFNYASTSVANGLGELKVQVRCNTVAAILKIPLSYLLMLVTKDWTCVVIANIIIMLPASVMQPIVNYRQLRVESKA